jgi:hypothetical protein
MNAKIHQDYRKFVITPKGKNLYVDVKQYKNVWEFQKSHNQSIMI